MKTEQKHAWIATALGAVGTAAGATALGRGWTKVGGGALLFSVSVPAYCWFQYFTQVDQPEGNGNNNPPQNLHANNAAGALLAAMHPWKPKEVKSVAQTYYRQQPIQLLDRVPKSELIWCLESCWDGETRKRARKDLLQHILADERVDYWVNGIGIENFRPFMEQSGVLCIRVMEEMEWHTEVVLDLLTSEMCASALDEEGANQVNCLRWCRLQCRTVDDRKVLEGVIARDWNDELIGLETELHKAKLHVYFLGGEKEEIRESDAFFIRVMCKRFGDVAGYLDRANPKSV